MARLRKRKSGDFEAIYYDGDGRRWFRSTKCSDKRAAEIAARRFEREARAPSHQTADDTSLGETLEDLMAHLMDLVEAGKRSRETVRMCEFKTGHLHRVFEVDAKTDGVRSSRLSTLAAQHVDTYISQRWEEGAAENTIAKELIALRSALKLAKRRGRWWRPTTDYGYPTRSYRLPAPPAGGENALDP